MESGFQRLLLARLTSAVLAGALLLLGTMGAHAQDEEEQDTRTVLDAVANPDIKREEIREDKIDSEFFEIGVYAGVMGIEDFGTNNVSGLRAALHISEDMFIEAMYGITEASQTSAEFLGNIVILTPEERELTYYNASFGVNIFPGEVYIGKKHAFNTSYFLIAGVGNTEFAGDEFFTYNFGGGFRFFATDWFTLHVDFRNHLFSHNIFTQKKSIQNLEAHLGFSFYF